MKKLLTAIAVAVFVIYPCVCLASYIIHLKDGREFATDRYYEEGEQVKFKRYGGVIGIQKDLVREIEEIEEVEELPEEKETAAPAKEDVSPPAKKQGAEAEGKVKEGKEGASESPEKAVEIQKPKEQGAPEKELDEEKGKEEREKKAKKIDVASYEREKRALMEKNLKARQRLNEARRTRDKAAIREAKKEIKESEKEMSNLALKLKKENGGALPQWWFRVELEMKLENPEGR